MHEYFSKSQALALIDENDQEIERLERTFYEIAAKREKTFSVPFKLLKLYSSLKAILSGRQANSNTETLAEPAPIRESEPCKLANALPQDEYVRAKARFGIDFRPASECLNEKIIKQRAQIAYLAQRIEELKTGLSWLAPRFVETDNGLKSKDQALSAVPWSKLCGNYLYQISIATLFKDEAQYLVEWIEFHRLVGVEHFFLFNNLSSDGFETVVSPYLKDGIVDLINWPADDAVGSDWIALQTAALNCALRLSRGRSKWLALIDTDEFLFPTEKDNLLEVLSEFDSYGSVAARHTLFGTSGVNEIPKDRLLIETLTRACQDDSNHNHLFKCIVRPEFVDFCVNSHYCSLKPGLIPVTEDKQPLNHMTIKAVKNNKLSLNHYWTRDESFFKEQKIPRLSAWGMSIEECLRNVEEFNEEERIEILRFLPKLRAALRAGDSQAVSTGKI